MHVEITVIFDHRHFFRVIVVNVIIIAVNTFIGSGFTSSGCAIVTCFAHSNLLTGFYKRFISGLASKRLRSAFCSAFTSDGRSE